MASTYTLISRSTLSSSATSITLSSIPNTYTDLKLVVQFAWTADTTDGVIRFNSQTGNIYSQTTIRGDGSAASSSRELASDARTGIRIIGNYGVSTNQVVLMADIFNYTSSIYKTVLTSISGNGSSVGQVARHVGLAQLTSTVSTIDLVKTLGTGSFASGTTVSLYGIARS